MSTGEAAEARVGSTIAGKYLLLRLLGAGGTGAVYEAKNLHTRRRVALKVVLNPELGEVQVRRMLREARTAAALEHPSIVQVLDMDVDPETGMPFLVQELLEGSDLRQVLRQEGRLAPRRAARIACDVLRGLAVAHAAGVIHRDVKPENVLLARTHAGGEQAKLIDFSIARFFDAADGDARAQESYAHASTLERTAPRRLAGTARYMSPEQVQDEALLDARTDLWSVGALLYELLTGQELFAGKSFGLVLAAVLTAPLQPLEAQGFDPALSRVVERALQRDKEQRWRSAENFADALEEWLEEVPHASDDAPPAPPPTEVRRSSAAPPSAPPAALAPAHPRRALAWVLGVLLLCVVAALALRTAGWPSRAGLAAAPGPHR